ncbi:hypothetical protein C366_02872 [Cryptococcus neoformans Tu401-1]|nr:hypothetical protein C366_02872 [Cryptococcus neoformans var. grubii Tu401-1]OXM79343.1 hypothetical protein C364_02840 [Cryptococcus neoformans var. grubii Bt63]
MTYPVYHHISQPYTYHTYIPVDENVGPSPIYALLVLSMVFFMPANVMPVLIPAVDRVWQMADPALKWGFFIIISAFRIHVTYVHMVTAFLLVAIVWNTFVPISRAQEEENKTPSVKEDKSTVGKKREISKEETKEEVEISPWDDLRAHPSTFLTTRLNKMMPWPFPMGKAAREGKELWWEKGTHLQLGHFNRERLGKVKEEEGSEKKMKPKPGTEKGEREREKERGKGSMTTGNEKISTKKEKAPGEAMTAASIPRREEDKRDQENAKIKESKARKQALEDRQRRKLCRTKNLVTIIGISSINMTLGFLLLIFYSFQIVSQELSHRVPHGGEELATIPSNSSSSSSSFSQITSNPESANEKQLMKLKTVKEKEVSNEKVSSSKAPSVGPKEEPATSRSIQKATGPNTMTKVNPESGGTGINVPYEQAEIGMYYIFNPDGKGENVENPSMQIPSLGMSHPLMTTTYKKYGN